MPSKPATKSSSSSSSSSSSVPLSTKRPCSVALGSLSAFRHEVSEQTSTYALWCYSQSRRFSACDGWFPDFWRFSGSERRFSGGTFRAVDLAREALAVDLATSQRMEELRHAAVGRPQPPPASGSRRRARCHGPSGRPPWSDVRSDGILLNTVLIIQLVARRQARAAANPSCTRSQAIAACEFEAWYLCLGGTGGSTTTDDPLAPVAGKTAEDSACYDEGTLADAIHHRHDTSSV